MFEPKSMKSQPITAHENFQYLSCAIIESFDHDLQLGTRVLIISNSSAQATRKAHTERDFFICSHSTQHERIAKRVERQVGTLLCASKMRKGVTPQQFSTFHSPSALKIGFWILFKYGWLAHQDKRVKMCFKSCMRLQLPWCFISTKRKRVARCCAQEIVKSAHIIKQPERAITSTHPA